MNGNNIALIPDSLSNKVLMPWKINDLPVDFTRKPILPEKSELNIRMKRFLKLLGSFQGCLHAYYRDE
jgi:hypothetical protein